MYNYIYITFVRNYRKSNQTRTASWSSDQSSWLQIQSSGFDSRRYQIFWEVVGLERGPLGIMSTTEGLLGRNSSGCGQENLEYSCGDPTRWLRDTPLSEKVVGTNFADNPRSLGWYTLLSDSGQGVCCENKSWRFFCITWQCIFYNTPNKQQLFSLRTTRGGHLQHCRWTRV
jgi:hypothetical protein